MTPQELELKVWELLDDGLNLEGGEMMVALKRTEIHRLAVDIRDLVLEAARGGVQ